MTTDSVTVVFGFDMETDIGSWTPYYEGLVHGTPLILDVMRQERVVSTCFFVGQAAKDHPEVVRQVRDAGHEIGAHSLFHETVGKSIFPIPGMHELLDHEIEPRLKLNTQWVEEAAGVRPVSFRCPRLFGSTAVCNALAKLGYIADASLPMYRFTHQRVPYRPSSTDWTKPGDLPLVEIPNFADVTMESHDEYGRDRDQWPLFRTRNAAHLIRHVDQFIGVCHQERVPVVLCFYFHPWEFWPMKQGLVHYGEGAVYPDPFLVQNCGPYAVEQFALLVRHLKKQDAQFITAAQCAREWGACEKQ
ncbi:MAG: polysaccharide deacetylase family protein [Phycisphaeraceae bacterium]|nr:polysaccharide deacetylase family protein [Phycisphaeraceae bacterium]